MSGAEGGRHAGAVPERGGGLLAVGLRDRGSNRFRCIGLQAPGGAGTGQLDSIQPV